VIPVAVGVALGGAAGGLLRWGADQVVPDGDGVPATTLTVNVLGAALLALLPALLHRLPADRAALLGPALGTGLLGGFTTFSAYAVQVRTLAADGQAVLAAATALATLLGCLAAVVAVRWAVPAARPRPHAPDHPGDDEGLP
jgi:CrcB protein